MVVDEGYGMLSSDNGTLVYTQKQKRKATWQRAGFQKRTKAVKEKGNERQDQGETRIPESHANTYIRQTAPHARDRLNLHEPSPVERTGTFSIRSVYLLPLSHNTFIFSGLDVLQCPFEVALRTLEARVWLVLAGLKVGVDELNQPIEILGRHSFVLLVEVIDVAVQNLDEQFH